MKSNLLTIYWKSRGKQEGIEQALNGMSMRTKFDSKMDEAIHDIKANYVPFLSEFQEFMPDVIAFSKQWQEEYEWAILLQSLVHH